MALANGGGTALPTYTDKHHINEMNLEQQSLY